MTPPLPSRPSEIKAWCAANGFHPSRSLGQNFLVDRNIAGAIVSAAGAGPGSRTLEVGPGTGALTRALLDAGAEVTAIEKDGRLAGLLREALGDAKGLRLAAADMLRVDLDRLLATGEAAEAARGGAAEDAGRAPLARAPYFDLMVSNLPYSVGTRILLDVCRHPLGPPGCVVMVQREVAERLAAGPGEPGRCLAGVLVQLDYSVETVRVVGPSCFWPRPEVSSAVVRLARLGGRGPAPEWRGDFVKIARLAFTHRRKQLGATFRRAAAATGVAGDAAVREWLASAGLDPRTRPEEVSGDAWEALAKAARAAAGKEAGR